MAIKTANTILESPTGQPEPVAVPGSAQNGTEAASTLHPHSRAEVGKTELLAQAVATMGGMSKEAINKFLEGLTMNSGPNQSKTTDGDASKNAASIATHPSAAMKEDVIEMFKGQNLSEETLEKAVTIFEAAVSLRLELENQKLVEEYDKKLDESVTEITEQITTRVDEYLTYIAEEWLTENEVAIDSQIQTDITTNFMQGLKNLFTENFIEIPENKIDVVEELTSENGELEQKLSDAMAEIIELKAKINGTIKPAIVEEFSVGLSDLQKEKFKKLIGNVDVNLPEEDYKKKVEIIREHYFKVGGDTGVVLNESAPKTPEEIAAETNAANTTIVEEKDPFMKSINDTIRRTARI